MSLHVYLHELPPGGTAVIDSIQKNPLSERLYDLGFIAGSPVECVARAANGGPSAYLVRGTLIALRRSDAAAITVRDEH